MKEQMRLFPLFGVAHRIASEHIDLPNGKTLHRGTVMLFNYQVMESDSLAKMTANIILAN